jgi:hypothetical protein
MVEVRTRSLTSREIQGPLARVSGRVSAAGKQTITDATGVKAGFIVRADLLGLGRAVPQVSLDGRAVAQVIGDHRMSIRELEGRIMQADFLSSRPLGKRHDDSVSLAHVG